MWPRWKYKCCFCGKRDQIKNLRIVDWAERHIYKGVKYRFHQACLDDILINPDLYSFSQVDRATDVIDIIEKEQKEVAERNLRYKAHCEKLKFIYSSNNKKI